MPFIAMLWGALLPLAASLAGRVIVALGFSAVTYTGVSLSLDFARDQAVNNLQLLGPEVVGMLSTMRVGQCISVVISATVMRSVLSGFTEGNMKKWVLK